MVAKAIREAADDQDNGLEGAEGYPVLRIGHGEVEIRLGEEVVKTRNGQDGGYSGLEKSPLEGDWQQQDQVNEACDEGLGVHRVGDPGNGRHHRCRSQNTCRSPQCQSSSHGLLRLRIHK